MAKHVTDWNDPGAAAGGWLGAYHDGELGGEHLRQVEQHLTACPTCQAELDEMRGLSALLQEAVSQVDFMPAERFVANLALSLPRQPEQPQPRSALKIAWWLIPVGLLGIWLFIDVTASLNSVVTLAASSGLLDGNLAWLQGGPLRMSWFATAMNLFGDGLGAPGWEVLSALNAINVSIARLAEDVVPQLILAVFYLGWLLSWWLRHQHQPTQSEESAYQS